MFIFLSMCFRCSLFKAWKKLIYCFPKSNGRNALHSRFPKVPIYKKVEDLSQKKRHVSHTRGSKLTHDIHALVFMLPPHATFLELATSSSLDLTTYRATMVAHVPHVPRATFAALFDILFSSKVENANLQLLKL